jgi:hypothetical protein
LTHTRTAKRFGLLLATVGVLTVATVPAVAQQRDPFDPLVSTGSATTDDTGGAPTSTDISASTSTESSADTTVEESSLPSTGSGVSEWLAIAYILVAIGAGCLLIAKVLSRQQKRR